MQKRVRRTVHLRARPIARIRVVTRTFLAKSVRPRSDQVSLIERSRGRASIGWKTEKTVAQHVSIILTMLGLPVDTACAYERNLR